VARSDSTIAVSIIGDTRKLTGALKSADRSVGTFSKSLGGVPIGVLAAAGAATVVAGAAANFLGGAVKEGDRLGDAITRLRLQLGSLAGPLQDTASNFDFIGQSKQDMLELEANFADMATAAGIADPKIASTAEQVAAIAAATKLLTGQDPTLIVKEIGQAAAGNKKPLKDLGVRLDDAAVKQLAMEQSGKKNAKALSDQDLATARLTLILQQLNPKLHEAASAQSDVEQATGKVNARLETLQGDLGERIQTPIATFIAALLTLGEAIDNVARPLTTELAGALPFLANDFDALSSHTLPVFERELGHISDLAFGVNQNFNAGADALGRFALSLAIPAIDIVSGGLGALGDILNNTVIPALGTLDDIVGGTLTPFLGAMATAIDTVLVPSVDAFGSLLNTETNPFVKTLADFIGNVEDAIPGARDGFKSLGDTIDTVAREALSPLARLADSINSVLNLLSSLGGAVGNIDINPFDNGNSERQQVRTIQNFRERNGINTRIGGP
jgi:hypothetical protein